MTELSPQAQEVFWAFNRAASGKPYDWHYLPAIAAALRAAADQVAYQIPDDSTAEEFNRQLKIRSELLAIAEELETND